MSSIDRAYRRDRKIKRRKYGHTVDNRSIFLIQEIQREKAKKIKLERELKERILNDNSN